MNQFTFDMLKSTQAKPKSKLLDHQTLYNDSRNQRGYYLEVNNK